MLLVPGDPLYPERPDEYFASEAGAARALDIEVFVVDHDALTSEEGGGRAVRRVRGTGEAVYRGWMIPSPAYAMLEQALATRDVRLRTNAAAYRTAHELPGWYDAFASLTPMTVVVSGPGSSGLAEALKQMPDGAAVVKDYVKSMKHYWDEAAFIPDVRDLGAATRVAERFLELRDAELVGSLVLRQFERFQPGEARTFWLDGRLILVTPHPDTPTIERTDLALGPVEQAVGSLTARFVTVDVALSKEGATRVVEVGDGQVSDLPETLERANLISALQLA